MEMKALLKVGAFLTVGIAIFLGLYQYLGHSQRNTYPVKVIFKDAHGLVKQSVVRMQGVVIGEVTSIEMKTDRLTENGEFPSPIIILAIQKEYRIPDDSFVKVNSGLLITTPQIEIVPGKSHTMLAQQGNAALKSVESGGALASISPELNEAVQHLNTTFSSLSKRLDSSYTKIDKLLDQTSTLLKAGSDTIGTAKSLISDPQVRTKLIQTLSNFEQTSVEARIAAKQLRTQFGGILSSSSGTIDELKESMLNLFDRLDTTLDDTNAVVKKVTDQVTDPRLQQSLQETVELARTTLARFNQLASDMHQFLGDPQLQGDLKQTLTNLKNATAQGEEAVGKVNNLLGKASKGNLGQIFQGKLPKVELLTNLSEQIDPDRFRVDMEARLGFGKDSLANVGLFDLGQDTRLILQGGRYLTDSMLVRYGLYASKIGIGAEYQLSPNVQFRGDLYDTLHPRLDFRTLFRVNKNASIWVGADGLGRSPSPRFGIQFHY